MRNVLLIICCVFTAVNAAAEAPAARPNVVFILADDQGWNDIGLHNPELRTPHLDQLAREGIELTNHYAQPQCTPSRVALITGRYPSRFGTHCLVASNEQAFPIGTPTLPQMFKAGGYATALCGKWHLGSKLEWGPNLHGFDHSYGSLAGAVGVYDHRYRIGTPEEQTWHRDLQFVTEEGHTTDLIAREAIQWIKDHKDAPFFLYVPFTAVHTPIVPKDEWLAANAHIEDPERRLFAGLLSHMDDAIGQIVRTLDEAGVRDNTLLVYTSDNGAQVDHGGNAYPPPDPALTEFSSNAPLRGRKSQAYEGGVRVPTFVNWPGHLKPGKMDAPMHLVDWMPTLAAATGLAPVLQNGDGTNRWPAINGAPTATGDRDIYEIWGQSRQWEALRLGDWKIVRTTKKKGTPPPWELYNLAQDPNETKDLAAAEPEALARLVQRFEEEKKLDAPANP